jgi:hypothetical protein
VTGTLVSDTFQLTNGYAGKEIRLHTTVVARPSRIWNFMMESNFVYQLRSQMPRDTQEDVRLLARSWVLPHSLLDLQHCCSSALVMRLYEVLLSQDDVEPGTDHELERQLSDLRELRPRRPGSHRFQGRGSRPLAESDDHTAADYNGIR